MATDKKLMDDESPRHPLSTSFRKHNIPTKEQVQALDGKIFDMLTEREHQVLDFFRIYGRKFGVTIHVVNAADPDALAQAKHEAQADAIMKTANSRVHVTVQ